MDPDHIVFEWPCSINVYFCHNTRENPRRTFIFELYSKPRSVLTQTSIVYIATTNPPLFSDYYSKRIQWTDTFKLTQYDNELFPNLAELHILLLLLLLLLRYCKCVHVTSTAMYSVLWINALCLTSRNEFSHFLYLKCGIIIIYE